MIEEWKEDTLPVNNARDQLWYIRDLILVKMICIVTDRTSNKNRENHPGDDGKDNESGYIPQKSDFLDTNIKVSFRRLVKSISSTTYASHGMYYYPAKFIPQVVRWAIDRYTSEGSEILDPFAGSGTVCVEALLTGRNATCIDLSPILNVLIEGKTFRNPSLEGLLQKASNITKSAKEYIPKWSNIRYWYPESIYRILSKMWGGYFENKDPILLLALLKTSKKYSFGDDQVPKLFKSKQKIKSIEGILREDYDAMIHSYFFKTVKEMYSSSIEFSKLYRGGNIRAIGDTDMLNYEPEGRYDLIVTSPPYGQAHEYIRSVKLELGWLGYGDEKIRELGKHEIPYSRNVPSVEIKSKTFAEYLAKVKSDKIRTISENYFKSVLSILDKCMKHLNESGHAAIFIGNASFGGITFPFHKIFKEHMEHEGYTFEILLEDKIIGRRLFKGRNNLSPNGMDSEYLLVMGNSKNISKINVSTEVKPLIYYA